MLQRVDVGERSLSAYRGLAPEALLRELRQAAESMRGVRVLHLSATPYGGGVSELLRSEVPLLNDLGLDVEWRIVSGDADFFRATKTLHNALQGAPRAPTSRQCATYEDTSRRNAADIRDGDYDVVVAHDPQTAAIPALGDLDAKRWVWRCHIDTSSPNRTAWEYLSGFVTRFEQAVFTMEDFVPPDVPIERVEIIPPAIDPLSPKNRRLDEATAREVLSWIGVDADRPLITQVSRFDPWKDPLGVIRAYREVRRNVPDVQLALVGSMALDDPQAWRVYREIAEETRDDPLVHVFTNLTGVGNIEVNAFQRLSDVIVQLSIREGFGLVVSEAMWKRTPVVAGAAGGIPLQMADGAGGVLVGDAEACAVALLELLEDKVGARQLADAGRERVHRYFLLPRLLLNDLSLLARVGHREVAKPIARDPVCGIALAGNESVAVRDPETGERFCSHRCLERFAPGG